MDNIMALTRNCNIKTHTDIYQKIDAVYDTIVNILLNAAENCVPLVKKISTNTGGQKNYLYEETRPHRIFRNVRKLVV